MSLGERRNRSRELNQRLLKSKLPRKKLKRENTKKSRLPRSQEKQSSVMIFYNMLENIILQLLRTI